MKPDRRASQATIMEVAIAAGVSLATVSRTTNHPDKVKPETREKILRIIKEKGYKPNLNAKSLASSKSTTVAVVVPELTRSSIAGLVDGIADCANRRGYFVRLFVNNKLKDGDVESLKDFWSTLMASVVDGVLYINDEMTEESIELIKNSSIPVVLTNIVCGDPEIPYVSIDYYKAAYEMTKEMIKRGNKKIWMINTIRKYVVNDLKVAGYSKAMTEAGLEPIVKNVPGKTELNEPIYKELLENDKPEVAIVVRDSMAVSFINVARLLHIHIPDEIEVIGFQNTKYAELSRPKLSCIETPIYDLGEEAMDLLTKLMDIYDSEDDDNEEEVEEEIDANIYVDYNVVWRESTKNN